MHGISASAGETNKFPNRSLSPSDPPKRVSCNDQRVSKQRAFTAPQPDSQSFNYYSGDSRKSPYLDRQKTGPDSQQYARVPYTMSAVQPATGDHFRVLDALMRIGGDRGYSQGSFSQPQSSESV